MNSYYIHVHFDGPYVSGFFIPQARDEEHARIQLKTILVARKIILLKEKRTDYRNDLDYKHVISFLRSISKPWRKVKRSLGRESPDSVCIITKWNLPLHIGFWGKDCITGKEICNLL